MKILIVISVNCLFLVLTVQAQNLGGFGDGFTKAGAIQSTLNGLQLNTVPLYVGGNGDGGDKTLFSGTLDGTDLTAMRLGGNGDGFNAKKFNGTLDGTDLSVIRFGGIGDGNDKAVFNGTLDGTNLSIMNLGGAGDGFNKENFNGTLGGIDLSIMHSGGVGDGFDKDIFNGALNGTDLSVMHLGGSGDGFFKDLFNGTLDGTNLSVMRLGGGGDGFDKAVFQGAVLPVELLSFAASQDGLKVRIDWETVMEINNDYYVVQHSPNGEVIEDLAVIASKGNGNAHTYRVYDEYPSSGVNYYRLKQVDYDGTIAYSSWIAVNFKMEFPIEAKLFPNPSLDGHGVLYVDLKQEAGVVGIAVFDPLGNQILSNTMKVGANNLLSIPIKLKDFASGAYIVRIRINDKEVIKKWILIQSE